MIKRLLIHCAHKIKFSLKDKRPFSGRGILLNLADKILVTPTTSMIIKTLHGFSMFIDPVNDKGVERSIYYTGTYEPGTLFIFEQLLRPGDTFIDIGSNIGLMAIFAAQKVGENGKVHCFEPEPNTFSLLEKNNRINRLKNTILNNLALGSEEKDGFIYPNFDINRGASSIIKKDTTPGKKINIITLDSYVERLQIKEIRLIKIDIEGYELEMLKGASHLLKSPLAPIICIEYSEGVEHAAELGDVYDFIKAVNKYRIFKFTLWKGEVCNLTEVYSKNDMPKHDNVFCFLPSHLEKVSGKIFETK